MSEELGNCFKAAFEFVMEHPEMTLVHGICTGLGKIAGIRFAHAWVEINGYVIDPSNGKMVIMAKKQYYELGQVEVNSLATYKIEDMIEVALKKETYGPWEEVFWSKGVE